MTDEQITKFKALEEQIFHEEAEIEQAEWCAELLRYKLEFADASEMRKLVKRYSKEITNSIMCDIIDKQNRIQEIKKRIADL
jgi:hypothetical protein